MLSDKDLVLASATMLTGILLIFTLFDFSVDEEIIYTDKKFLLEEHQEYLDNLHNVFPTRTEFYDNYDVLEGCEGKSVSYDVEIECLNRVFTKVVTNEHELRADIRSYEENKAKEIFILSDKLQLLSLIVYALTATSIFAILHSMKTKNSPIVDLFAPICFMFAWAFVLLLALNLSGV